MANLLLKFDSFNAGQLTPLLGARLEVEKVMSGCRMLRNFIPHVHGPATRRPGLEMMGAALGGGFKSNLRGFNYSASTGFVLEFHPTAADGSGGLQVWSSSGGAIELENPVELPYSESECFELQTAQVNDVVWIAHPNHAPRRLVRYPDAESGAAVWKLEDVHWKWAALGDENTRNDEIATPTTSELLNVPTHEWPEFQIPGPQSIELELINPDTTAAQKIAKLQRRNLANTTWVTEITFSWTTVAPGSEVVSVGNPNTWRITYSGPVAATGEVKASWNAGADDFSLLLDDPQPESLQSVLVPAGEWQVLLTSNTTLPTNSPNLNIQKWTGTIWKKLKDLVPRAGESRVWRGPKLLEATQIRLKWEGRAMDGEMSVEQVSFPTSTSIEISLSHLTGNNRTMTASSAIFQPGHAGSYWQIVHRRAASSVSIVSAQPTIVAATSAALRVQGSWEVFSYGTWNATLFLEKFVNGAWETLRSWDSNKDRNVIANGTEEQEVELRLRISAGTSEEAEFVAVPRFTLEATDARVHGLVKVLSVGSLDAEGKSTTATVDIIVSVASTDPTSLWTEGAWSDVRGFPRSVALHGQRLWFGGTRSETLRTWGSVINDFENFRRSTFDDASVSFTPSAQQSNALQWMRSFGEDLVIGTLGDEWTLSGGVERGPITPTSVLMQARSSYGSEYLPALLMGDVVTFVQRGGRKIRQVAPRADGIVWKASDLTVLAEGVTGSGIVQTAVMSFPFTILWAVTVEGKLLGMTHETEQNVFAWHVHETDGIVESVAVMQGTESDEVWVSVLRNGQRNIERLDPNVFGQRYDLLSSLCYTDGAVKYDFETPTAVLTGLDHLEGKLVYVLGDGAEMTPRTVGAGEITLESAISVAVVGLPYESKLQPMRRDVQMRNGTANHRQWKSCDVGLNLINSLACEVADGEDGRFETVQFREAGHPMDSAPPLFSGEKEIGIEARTREGIDIVIRTDKPLPLNVGGITWKGDISGDG